MTEEKTNIGLNKNGFTLNRDAEGNWDLNEGGFLVCTIRATDLDAIADLLTIAQGVNAGRLDKITAAYRHVTVWGID